MKTFIEANILTVPRQGLVPCDQQNWELRGDVFDLCPRDAERDSYRCSYDLLLLEFSFIDKTFRLNFSESLGTNMSPSRVRGRGGGGEFMLPCTPKKIPFVSLFPKIIFSIFCDPVP